MAEPFAEVEDVHGRLDFTMTAAEETVCANALDDMSEEARFHGKAWEIPELAPRMVRRIVLGAVARYMKNLDGLIQSRAGDETVIMPDLGNVAGAPYFTDAEKDTLRRLAGKGKGGFATAEATAFRTQDGAGDVWVQTAGGGTKPFPFNEEWPRA